jgi:hypothetical protein
MNGCGCERVWSVALADMVCVYVVLHDVAGGIVCGVSGRGCGGGGWLDIRGYVLGSGGWVLFELRSLRSVCGTWAGCEMHGWGVRCVYGCDCCVVLYPVELLRIWREGLLVLRPRPSPVAPVRGKIVALTFV